MINIIIYTKSECIWCEKAKTIFLEKEYTFEERNVYDYLEEFKLKTNNAKTVPQIFINDTLLGGYEDLIKSSYV